MVLCQREREDDRSLGVIGQTDSVDYHFIGRLYGNHLNRLWTSRMIPKAMMMVGTKPRGFLPSPIVRTAASRFKGPTTQQTPYRMAIIKVNGLDIMEILYPLPCCVGERVIYRGCDPRFWKGHHRRAESLKGIRFSPQYSRTP